MRRDAGEERDGLLRSRVINNTRTSRGTIGIYFYLRHHIHWSGCSLLVIARDLVTNLIYLGHDFVDVNEPFLHLATQFPIFLFWEQLKTLQYHPGISRAVRQSY
jgi:hypothetical protein